MFETEIVEPFLVWKRGGEGGRGLASLAVIIIIIIIINLFYIGNHINIFCKIFILQ